LLAISPLEHVIIWSYEVTTATRRHRRVRCHGSFCSASAWSIQPRQC
jgi:hypothetical protein